MKKYRFIEQRKPRKRRRTLRRLVIAAGSYACMHWYLYMPDTTVAVTLGETFVGFIVFIIMMYSTTD